MTTRQAVDGPKWVLPKVYDQYGELVPNDRAAQDNAVAAILCLNEEDLRLAVERANRVLKWGGYCLSITNTDGQQKD